MGMTINDAKKELLKHKSPYYNCVADAEANEAIDVAIETMLKYQQIEQILKDIPYGGDATVRRIQEVVEDGNND